MRGHHALALLAWGVAALSAACSPAPSRNAAPAVWAVRDADTLLYITGTVHLLPDGVNWRNGPIVAAMADAEMLITELSPAELARVAEAARAFLYRDNSEAIAARFPADLRDDYAEIAGSLPTVPNMARLDDWAVALLLAQIVAARAGLEADNGMDGGLIDAFADAGKPRSGLERATDQFGQFDAIPLAEQRRALTEMMRNIAAGTADDRLNETVDAWARGDLVALAEIIARDAEMNPETYRLLLDVRNERWAKQLAARMEKPGKLLVAVGAGHLAGPDSLLAKLAERGLKAERLR